MHSTRSRPVRYPFTPIPMIVPEDRHPTALVNQSAASSPQSPFVSYTPGTPGTRESKPPSLQILAQRRRKSLLITIQLLDAEYSVARHPPFPYSSLAKHTPCRIINTLPAASVSAWRVSQPGVPVMGPEVWAIAVELDPISAALLVNASTTATGRLVLEHVIKI